MYYGYVLPKRTGIQLTRPSNFPQLLGLFSNGTDANTCFDGNRALVFTDVAKYLWLFQNKHIETCSPDETI